MSPDDYRQTIGTIARELLSLVPDIDRVRALRAAAGEVESIVDLERETERPPGYASATIEPVIRAETDKR